MDFGLDSHGQGEAGAVGGDVEVEGVDVVAADDLLGPALVVGERFRRLLDDAAVVLERPSHDGLVAGVAVLAVARAAVADGAQAVQVVQEPADANAVAERTGA
ncbi:hypothetical protein [Streptomyces sp. MAI_2237]